MLSGRRLVAQVRCGRCLLMVIRWRFFFILFAYLIKIKFQSFGDLQDNTVQSVGACNEDSVVHNDGGPCQ